MSCYLYGYIVGVKGTLLTTMASTGMPYRPSKARRR